MYRSFDVINSQFHSLFARQTKTKQEEYAELKAQEQRSAKKRAEIESQNKTLSQPLAAAEAEVTDLRHKVQHYEKDKLSLRQIKARLLVLEEQFRSLNSEHGALQRRFATVQHERDMLHETFEQSLQWVQQRNAHSQQRLQHRLDDVQGRVEQKVRLWARARWGTDALLGSALLSACFAVLALASIAILLFFIATWLLFRCGFRAQNAQLAEVMRAGQLDAVVLRNVTDKLDSVLTSKNQHNKQLKHDIARVQKVRC
jgi:hypothetical protein